MTTTATEAATAAAAMAAAASGKRKRTPAARITGPRSSGVKAAEAAGGGEDEKSDGPTPPSPVQDVKAAVLADSVAAVAAAAAMATPLAADASKKPRAATTSKKGKEATPTTAAATSAATVPSTKTKKTPIKKRDPDAALNLEERYRSYPHHYRLNRIAKGNRRMWTQEEDRALALGLQRYGSFHDRWALIKIDPDFKDILSQRTTVDLKDKHRNNVRAQARRAAIDNAAPQPPSTPVLASDTPKVSTAELRVQCKKIRSDKKAKKRSQSMAPGDGDDEVKAEDDASVQSDQDEASPWAKRVKCLRVIKAHALSEIRKSRTPGVGEHSRKDENEATPVVVSGHRLASKFDEASGTNQDVVIEAVEEQNQADRSNGAAPPVVEVALFAATGEDSYSRKVIAFNPTNTIQEVLKLALREMLNVSSTGNLKKYCVMMNNEKLDQKRSIQEIGITDRDTLFIQAL